ncbi:MAG: RNA polymerase sigma factor ShbA [Nocardia sp.]|nr:RNA polymerase sigma factor ShbA [Nocardia sp.]
MTTRAPVAVKSPDELELDLAVAAAVAGDRSAVATIMTLILPPVVRYCRARINPGHRGRICADDVAQDVCFAVMTSLPRYQDRGRPFMAFVLRVASHKVADAHRDFSRQRVDPMAQVPDVASTDGGPEQRALESEANRQMDSLLATLPDKHREILVLRLILGLSAEETAAAVGGTAGAVRVTQHRALTKLRSQVRRPGSL